MVLSGLTMVSFAAVTKPAEIHKELASVKVTCSGDPSVVCYFEDLNQGVIEWACKQLPGESGITLLQDTELFTLTTSSVYLEIPSGTSDWYDSSAARNPLVVDLGGHTLSFYGAANLFSIGRYGFTLRNGTVLYTNTAGKSRSPFCFGQSTGETATSSGKTSFKPVLDLENVHIYNLTQPAGPIVRSYYYDTVVNVTDSVLWAKGSGTAVSFNKTSQSAVANPYTGPYQPRLNVKNSVIGSDEAYTLSGKEGTSAGVEDSTLVSGRWDGFADELQVTSVGETVLNQSWAMTLRDGRMVKGNGFTVGKAPVFLPFTDVKQSDWFYGYVSQLYSRKIIAGQTAATFAPNGNLTYAAALKLLTVGLTGEDAGNAASGHWAANYLNIAKANGWTDLAAAKLDQPITREAFCEIAAKAANLTKQPAANSFTDTDNPAVLALVEAGVINGMSIGVFRPDGILTRAQISKIISLLLDV